MNNQFSDETTIERAKQTATRLHKGQYRKGFKTAVEYITHPLAVADILKKYTTDENVIVAGILHDTLEDCDYLQGQMANEFGSKVAAIVADVTEDKELKRSAGEKASWALRKQKYLDHLRGASSEALMVCAADKIHNLNSIVGAYEQIGEALWDEFNGPPQTKLEFYARVVEVIKERLDNPIVEELEETYDRAYSLVNPKSA